jgi:transposase-like protein
MESAEVGGGSAGRKGVFPPPRKLNEEQELEVTRLYSQTDTPIAEIAGRFSIGESSVYRVAQRHGAKLRGRTGRRPAATRPTPTRAAAVPAATRAPAQPSRRGRPRTTPVRVERQRFRVSFVAVAMIEAESIRDAVAQAEARGATDITAIAREE